MPFYKTAETRIAVESPLFNSATDARVVEYAFKTG